MGKGAAHARLLARTHARTHARTQLETASRAVARALTRARHLSTRRSRGPTRTSPTRRRPSGSPPSSPLLRSTRARLTARSVSRCVHALPWGVQTARRAALLRPESRALDIRLLGVVLCGPAEKAEHAAVGWDATRYQGHRTDPKSSVGILKNGSGPSQERQPPLVRNLRARRCSPRHDVAPPRRQLTPAVRAGRVSRRPILWAKTTCQARSSSATT